jgi:RNA polymerase sigma factor (sigma-70 family)
MADGRLGAVLRHLHGLAAARNGEQYTDGELLEQLDGPGAEGAFAALLRRHGPMVLGACRRVLRDGHDAEDAFQATFLVLFRRARHLDRRGPVAGWLYTVACHAAHRARAALRRRRLWEGRAAASSRASTTDAGVDDLHQVLDEELSRLPERLRLPVVLCYLEGRTNEEAGRLLSCPAGTVKSRLARARGLLRIALTRRGVAPSAALLGGLLTEKVRATVPASLLQAAVRTAFRPETAGAAVTLAQGVFQTMFRTKLQVAVGLLAFVALALGAGTLSFPAGAAGPKTERDPARAPVVVVPPALPAVVKYSQLFTKVHGVLGDFFEIGYANRYDGRIETLPRALPGVRCRALVCILVADDGWYEVGVIVSTERRAGGWPAIFLSLFGADDATRWAPARRNAGLEALLLRCLKQAGLGDTVRLHSCYPPVAAPQAGTSPTSAPRK